MKHSISISETSIARPSRVAAVVVFLVGYACIFTPLSAQDSVYPADTTNEWQVADSSLALKAGDQLIWRFNYGPTLNKPFFHPLATPTGKVLTWNAPEDHAWHHALWFSWKYINGVNYWENDKQTGKPSGRTEWYKPKITTNEDFSAEIEMTIDYRPAEQSGSVLREQRRILISPPDSTGVYAIDWESDFEALQNVKLDRTPPASPASSGGYAGLSVRFAADFEESAAMNLDGPAEFNSGNRHRGKSNAMDYGGLIDESPVGVAILDHPKNPRHPTPWYLIANPTICFINAALLSDAPLELESGEHLVLKYRIIIHDNRWEPSHLKKAYGEYATPPEQQAVSKQEE